jgi:hypothetical protein
MIDLGMSGRTQQQQLAPDMTPPHPTLEPSFFTFFAKPWEYENIKHRSLAE